MSVLIRDMEMPSDCCQCKLARYDDYENETFCPFTDVMCLSIGRQNDCPLEEVPEHEYTMEEFMYGQDMGNPEDGSL